ncbi:MAG TPA: hypothetical protein VFU40_00340, partial [Gemmatimonadales bacterium]|nr:hypothetical protein [Gemmatimonadales bacterium]
AAPAVASKVLAAAALGAAPLTVARTLLPPDAWANWFRPQAYDLSMASPSDCGSAEGLEDARDAIAQVLAVRPILAGDGRWCPRCAATYRAGFTTCAECAVALLGPDDNVALKTEREAVGSS